MQENLDLLVFINDTRKFHTNPSKNEWNKNKINITIILIILSAPSTIAVYYP